MRYWPQTTLYCRRPHWRRCEGLVMMDSRDVIIRPILTEKTTLLAESGKYAFRVHDSANKLQIRRAVEELFRVDVVAVNVARMKGKWRRFGRSRGRRPDWKKSHRHPSGGAIHRIVPGNVGWIADNAAQDLQANITRASQLHLCGRFGHHDGFTPQAAPEAAKEARGAKQPGPYYDAAAGRRRQAPNPGNRLQARQARYSGQSRVYRIRPQQVGPNRAAELR